ncbi:MAG: polyprenyl synthetase family protein [Candidatus Promineifilaceae bacterium]
MTDNTDGAPKSGEEEVLSFADRKKRLLAACDPFAKLLELETNHIMASLDQSTTLITMLQWFAGKDQAKKREKWPYAYLPFLTCCLVGGRAEKVTAVATSWNLLHLAAHLFDDIADEGFIVGPEGRLSPGEGVNLATSFLFLAQLALDKLPATDIPLAVAWELRRQLNQMVINMCAGQHQDLAAISHPDSNQALYWQVAAAKTGNFFSWAGQSGAQVGGSDEAESAACAQFSHNLGLLLQIMDDWYDLYTQECTSDLAQGKRTLPVLYALAAAAPAQKQMLEEMLSVAPLDAARETVVRQAVLQLGGMQYVLAQAEMRRQRAQATLTAFSDEVTKSYLCTLLDLAFPFAGRMK